MKHLFIRDVRRAGDALLVLVIALCANSASAQSLNQNCVVSVLNRTVQVNPDGSWVLPNVPANFGPVRARATCVQNGLTTFGQSAMFSLSASQTVNLPHIQFGPTTPIPNSMSIATPVAMLDQ